MRNINVLPRLKMPILDEDSDFATTARFIEHLVKSLSASNAETMHSAFARYEKTNSLLLASLAGLHDELETYTAPDVTPSKDQQILERIRVEFEIYSTLCNLSQNNRYMNPGAFTDDSLKVNAKLSHGIGKFREAGMRMVSHDESAMTRFPHWRYCPELIEQVDTFIRGNIQEWPSVCALVAYGGIIHAHPFSDGNGRTARTMYNLVLHSAGYKHFLPISLVASQTGSSLVLKLRRLVLGNDWQNLQCFIRDAFMLSKEWQTLPL